MGPAEMFVRFEISNLLNWVVWELLVEIGHLVTNRRVAETKAVLGQTFGGRCDKRGASGADVIQLGPLGHWLLSVPKRALPRKRTTYQ